MKNMEEYQKNKFWNSYIGQLNKRTIKENAQRWYVIHVEQYVKSIPDKKLKYYTAENVCQYFSVVGQNKSLTEWPFHLCIQASDIMFSEVLRVTWYQEFDGMCYVES